MKHRSQRRITRRQFVGGALAAAGAAAGAPAILRARNLSNTLNIAMIGAGGRGAANLNGVSSENIAALCDVDANALEKSGAKHPEAKRFVDFRKMFDDPKDFDAVVVSTCEHTHVFATMLALKAGKHVYCEKPLTYNIWEARLVRETASKLNLATQMERHRVRHGAVDRKRAGATRTGLGSVARPRARAAVSSGLRSRAEVVSLVGLRQRDDE